MSKTLSIIVPVYNESNMLDDFIIRLKGIMQKITIPVECIVVDDGSRDGSLEIIRDHNLFHIVHNDNQGYGAALKTGIRSAKNDFICIIDADNTYEPNDILRLINHMDFQDMIVGSRGYRFPLYQRFAKGCISFILEKVFSRKIPDINSGLRIMRTSVIKRYIHMLSDGFSFTATSTLIMLLCKKNIQYIPVSYRARKKSNVKIFGYTVNFIRNYWRIIYAVKIRKSLV